MPRKKRRNISIRNKRKWSCRGRSLADFICSILVTCLGYLFQLIIDISASLKNIIVKKRDQKKKIVEREDGVTHSNFNTPNVCMDQSHQIIQGEQSNVCFNDIAGLDDAKREINLRMVMPFKHPEQACKYHIRRGGGLLLYGPPGTGKTMLAKAVSNELNAPFFRISPSDVISGQVGQAEKNISNLFEKLRQQKKAVLFIDEIESLVPRRKKNSSTIMQRVISQILSEIDGFKSSHDNNTLFIIGATNEITMIDPAMLRPGRFDTHIYVGPPDYKARRKLLQDALKNRPIADDINIEELVTKTNGMTGAEINEVINKAADGAFISAIQSGYDHFLSNQIILQNISNSFNSRIST